MTNYIARGRQVVLPLTNKSAGAVAAGDTVILSSGTAASFTTTTSAGQTDDFVGVVYDATIAQDAVGLVIVQGFVPLITLSSSASLGDYVKTHSVAKQSAPSATRGSGSFGQVLGTGTTPAAFIWGFPDPATAAGNVANDAIWDAAGDLAVGTGADTAGRLAKGSAGGALSMINSAVAWNSGTSMPGSKATGDRYWRTDLGLEFYWDGTRWLTTTLYIVDMPPYDTVTSEQPITNSGYNTHRSVPITDILDMWMVDFRATIRVNTTNNGSHYWTFLIKNYSASTTLATFNTSAKSADTIYRVTATAGALVGTGNILLQTSLEKTGSPGTVDVLTAGYSYRLVGT